ncbi:MAG: chromosomal replication initiator protein DnaA [Bradymonadia bacterium]
MRQVWESALSSIRSRVTAANYTTYFEPLRLVKIEGGQALIQVEDPFFGDWVRDHYADLLVDALSEASGRPVSVEIEVKESNKAAVGSPQSGSATKAPHISNKNSTKSNARKRVEAVEDDRTALPDFPLNPHYTFDQFVVGDSNQFAYAACDAIAQRPAQAYNPLFIYGDTGLGKTHLLHAIAHEMRARHQGVRVAYLSAEEFTNQVINAISTQSMDRFRAAFRMKCDVLLVDDIHVLSGKERTQEEFFHTFNALHAAQKQIVLTSDKTPQEIHGLENRLRSRFQWGLIADIKPPALETRVAILRAKAARNGIELPDDVSMFLAEHIRNNVRELEGALIRLAAYCSLSRKTLTLPVAQEALRNLIDTRARAISIEAIQRLVADHFDVKISDLKGHRRHKAVAHPRSVAMYLCRKHTQCSYPQIGARFGGKDHSTVIAAFRKVERNLKTDMGLRAEVEAIERRMP